MIHNLLQDCRFALRQFLKRPAFTLTAVVILALGLGANTAIFSVVNAFLLRPLPYRSPDRLVALFERNVVGNDELHNWISPGNFLDWQRLSTTFENMSAWNVGPSDLSSAGSSFRAERVESCACSGNLFDTLGVSPLLGRAFRPDEDRYGAPRVAIISYQLWQRNYGGTSDVIGKQIRLDGENVEIAGVMPQGFAFPDRTVEVWIPLLTQVTPERQMRHDIHFLQVLGRLRNGASIEQARTEIDGIAARYQRTHPGEVTGKGANVLPLHDSMVREVRTSLLLLLGAVSCVLLIACVNVANLLLTRAAGRSREISIRAAIGASRGRIVRQLLTESVLLSLAGGALGIWFAVSITEILVSHAPGADAILPGGQITVDPTLFLFAFGIALLTGIAAGLLPAVQTSRADLTSGLKDSSRSSTSSRSQGSFRNALVAAEMVLSLVLLIAAGLLLRSFAQLFRVNPGVRVDHTITMQIDLPGGSYRTAEKRAALLTELSDNLRTLPGISGQGIVSCAPVSGHCNDLVFSIEGRILPPGELMDSLQRSADPDYFASAGIPLLKGRNFTKQDGVGFDEKHPKPGVIVISESLAKQYFPNEDPLGKRIVMEFDVQREKLGYPAPRYQIIGVVGDVLTKLDAPVTPTFYVPLHGNEEVAILMHTSGDPTSVFSSVRERIAALYPDVALYNFRTMEQTMGISAADRRFSMLLFGAFAALALLLAAVGLYGVLSYGVSQRMSEIGIRMALGASSSEVGRLVLRQGMKPALIGIAIGLAAAVVVCQLLKSLLFGIEPMDPLTFALAPVLLLAIAALACYLPAMRASRIDPTIALRTE